MATCQRQIAATRHWHSQAIMTSMRSVLFILAWLDLTQVEVDEMLRLMGHVGAEVAPHDGVPSRVVPSEISV